MNLDYTLRIACMLQTVSSTLVKIQSEGISLKNEKLCGRSLVNHKQSCSRKWETATLGLGFHHNYVMGCNLGTEYYGSRLKMVVHSINIWPFMHERVSLQFLQTRRKRQCKNSRKQTSLEHRMCNSTLHCHLMESSEKNY